MVRRDKDLETLLAVIEKLAEERKLAPQYRNHSLKGKYKNKRDCHFIDLHSKEVIQLADEAALGALVYLEQVDSLSST